MKPKDKAKELFKKYSKGKDDHGWYLCEFDSCAKQCALIAVDEILELIDGFDLELTFNYYLEVKKEINKL